MRLVPPNWSFALGYRVDMCRLTLLIFVLKNKGMPSMLYANACYGGIPISPITHGKHSYTPIGDIGATLGRHRKVSPTTTMDYLVVSRSEAFPLYTGARFSKKALMPS